jgi:hypothetical protein
MAESRRGLWLSCEMASVDRDAVVGWRRCLAIGWRCNTIEGFWLILKGGVINIFRNVSKKYLPLYVAEFQFRYNNRKNPDILDSAMARC